MTTQADIDYLRKAGVSETIIDFVKDTPQTLSAVVEHERQHALIASYRVPSKESEEKARAIFHELNRK